MHARFLLERYPRILYSAFEVEGTCSVNLEDTASGNGFLVRLRVELGDLAVRQHPLHERQLSPALRHGVHEFVRQRAIAVLGSMGEYRNASLVDVAIQFSATIRNAGDSLVYFCGGFDDLHDLLHSVKTGNTARHCARARTQ